MNTHVTLTYEERARANAKAVRQRTFGNAKATEREPRYYAPPTLAMAVREPRNHVLAWHAYLEALKDFNAPRRFVKMECFHHGVSYQEICSKSRTDRLAQARKLIMRATHEAFPHLSSNQLGKLINKDHTTILFHLGRLGCKSQSAKDWREKKARAG